MPRLTLALALVGAGGFANADPAAPRSAGRAGTGTVSDDGAGAAFTSPAALARRGGLRVVAGTAIVDDGLEHAPDGADTTARAQGGAALLPTGAAIAGAGPLVVALAVAADGEGRSFAAPDPGLGATSVNRFFAYRYAGLSARLERRAAALALAARVTDWLALGAAATLSTVRVQERRRIWAGFTGRGDVPGDPDFDVDVRLDADDAAVPGAVFGAFVAPASIPLELAGSIAWSNEIHVRGAAALAPASAALATTGGDAALDLPTAVVVRGGARWLGDRWTAELGVDAWLRDPSTPAWRLAGASVTDVVTQASSPLALLPSRFALRRRIAARAALDVEAVSGFLWLTAGYAWTGAGTPDDRLAPTTAMLAEHTAALGVEIAAGRFTATLGWSRSFTRERAITSSALRLDDPFDPVATPVGLGRYDATRDVFGLSLEWAKD